ncbi:MAG: xanthine dehydrogenase family protein subunit M [Pyrinomonadaceae bacterium]|nr:xanthine dehydrogenase family protein subunit M [Pyrinomonadaceae bacterium]MBP9108992.1 xanthine dehydrogenase family protein subunit M [Pyrinomonadaceae bacterium]
MKSFSFKRAADPTNAVQMLGADRDSKFIAGGTNILDLMKEGIEQPTGLIDISRLALSVVKANPAGGVSIGALARNTDTANHPLIRQNYPMLTQAILAGASPQIRNMATNGGNLMQRTRCPYFYDLATPCNKRQPGTGCSAKDGLNRYSAIFGWSDSCVAVHPSDMCVALAALDAIVKVRGANGKERSIKFADFHVLPAASPQKDNSLAHGELITSIDLPTSAFAKNSYYLKVRERSSYAFALVSVAAALDLAASGTIKTARIALGGVAAKPWRAEEAEKYLVGKKPGEAAFREAAKIAVSQAKPLSDNGYKVKMAERSIFRALTNAMNGGAA